MKYVWYNKQTKWNRVIHEYLTSKSHPGERAHAGAGLFIKSSIKYNICDEFRSKFLQAAGVKVTFNKSPINIYSIYFPPRHVVKQNYVLVLVFKTF